MIQPSLSIPHSASQSPAVQASPAMQRKDVAVMITMHAGMEKVPTMFYKGPWASRAIFSIRGLSPLLPLSAGEVSSEGNTMILNN